MSQPSGELKSSTKPIYVNVKGLTAKDVTRQPLLKYCDKRPRHVKSSSLHGLWFVDSIEEWQDFEDQAASVFAIAPWSAHTSILAYDISGERASDFHIHAADYFVCGEELSISGRWVQHALHPMSAVGKELGFTTVFGDWKATAQHGVSFVQSGKVDPTTGEMVDLESQDGGKAAAPMTADLPGTDRDLPKRQKRKELIPDYVLMVEEDGAVRAVGEAKTPWKHNFEKLWLDLASSEEKLEMRRALGQIGNYMIELGLKYGFLTNYESTFFLKREGMEGKETICCSTPIAYNASPVRGDKISVRQGLFFLQYLVRGNEWFAEKLSDHSIIKKRKEETVGEVKARVKAVLNQDIEKRVADPSGQTSGEHPDTQGPAGSRSGTEGLTVQFTTMDLNPRRKSARFANPLRPRQIVTESESSALNPRKK
ncbi:hypothetical protein FQN50_007481 [Emmonsiellopsis sp. PD_5]|nr:hypothetical protein FQN50_007481 [Emmonsiellopsis sp. PD_5]